MGNTDNFVSKWKINHEKGILIFLIKRIVPIAVLLIFTCFFFSYINGTIYSDDFYRLIRYNILFIVLLTTIVIYDWFSSVKKYKRITEDNNANNNANNN